MQDDGIESDRQSGGEHAHCCREKDVSGCSCATDGDWEVVPSSQPKCRTIKALVHSRVKTNMRAMARVVERVTTSLWYLLMSGSAKLDRTPGGGGCNGTKGGIFIGSALNRDMLAAGALPVSAF